MDPDVEEMIDDHEEIIDDDEETDCIDHHHSFVIMHNIPEEYHMFPGFIVSCNWCDHTIMTNEDDYCGNKRGFLHCQRKCSTKRIVNSIRIDSTVEELYRKRTELGMVFDEILDYFDDSSTTCDFDLCWECYFEMKKAPSLWLILPPCEC